MPERSAMLRTIESVHAAGMDEELWPGALAAIANLLDMAGASLEVMDLRTSRLMGFWSHGLPGGAEIPYEAEFMATNPRRLLQPPDSGGINYDYLMMPEDELLRHPFYEDFLRPIGLRYFISSILVHDAERFACIALHRTAEQGHVERREIDLLRQLTPHLKQAYDVTHRLRQIRQRELGFEQALNWMRDGVLLVGPEGEVAFANEAAQALLRNETAIGIARGRLEFKAAEARGKFDDALASIGRLRENRHTVAGTDFIVPRGFGQAALVVAVRPLVPVEEAVRGGTEAMVLIRDPAAEGARAAGLLVQETYGFTESEASLADALVQNMPLAQYAALHGVSMNTVYTHLRHIKAKTGYHRMAELTGRLAELRPPLL